MSCRYAVLHHVGIERPHFDLVFEFEPEAAALTTFRCPTWPPAVGDFLEELPEHRRPYLDYEGPISGGRGSVTRVAGGTVEVTELTVDPPTLSLRLNSPREPSIEFALTHEFGDAHEARWVVATLRECRA